MAVAGLSCSLRDLRSSLWHVGSLVVAQGIQFPGQGLTGPWQRECLSHRQFHSQRLTGPKARSGSAQRSHLCNRLGLCGHWNGGATWQNFSCTLAQPPWFQPKWMKTLTAVGNMKRESEERQGHTFLGPLFCNSNAGCFYTAFCLCLIVLFL